MCQKSTYIFVICRVSDVVLLLAPGFNDSSLSGAQPHNRGVASVLVAGVLLTAAFLKTSHFPVMSLFSRSIEGIPPSSAVGDASLAAHIVVALLSGTMPLRGGLDWARFVLLAVGDITMICNGLAT